jgi:hypothetical protein
MALLWRTMLLLKLDVAKSFDNVRWEYMLEAMKNLGFGQLAWPNGAIVATSSRILLNGEPGRPIKHVWSQAGWSSVTDAFHIGHRPTATYPRYGNATRTYDSRRSVPTQSSSELAYVLMTQHYSSGQLHRMSQTYINCCNNLGKQPASW